MASEEVFQAVKGAFSWYGALLKDVGEEIGFGRALDLHAKRGESFGVVLAGMIQDRLGDEELNIEAMVSVASEVTQGFGMSPEIEQTATSAKFRYHECPIYDGLKMAGWEHKEIEAACNCSGSAEFAEVAKAFPQFTGGLEFRATPDEPCTEAFSIES